MPALIDNMIYRGKTPWHGLGYQLQGDESVDDMVRLAGLDWQVDMEPIYLHGASKAVPDFRAAVRSDTAKVLGVVGNRWQPLQNRDAFHIFEPLVESGDLVWDTAGSLMGGKRVWVLCQINTDPIEVLPNDPVKAYALLSHGHDGKLAVHFGFTPIRVVCANTEAAARNCKSSTLVRVRHSLKTKKRVEQLRDIMDLSTQTFQATVAQYQFLASRYYNQNDVQLYVNRVFGVHDDDKVSPRKRNILNSVERLVDTAVGNDIPGVSGTWWGLYNAVTQYYSYGYGRSRESRLNALWFGQSRVQLASALDLALTMAS